GPGRAARSGSIVTPAQVDVRVVAMEVELDTTRRSVHDVLPRAVRRTSHVTAERALLVAVAIAQVEAAASGQRAGLLLLRARADGHGLGARGDRTRRRSHGQAEGERSRSSAPNLDRSAGRRALDRAVA